MLIRRKHRLHRENLDWLRASEVVLYYLLFSVQYLEGEICCFFSVSFPDKVDWLISTSLILKASLLTKSAWKEGTCSPAWSYSSGAGPGGTTIIPNLSFFPYVAKSIQDRVGFILFEPCHVWAIFTPWFTFSKDNHGENICRQLSGCSTISSSSNPIFFFIYFASVTHVSNVMKGKTGSIMG